MYQKQKVFYDELKLIKSPVIKDFASFLIEKLPDYFFEVAASSTGKYHSDTCCGSGGLVRHTKAAVMFARSLWDEDNQGLKQFSFSDDGKDWIIVALIMHDGWKHGLTDQTGFTAFDHPLVAAEQIQKYATEFDALEKHEVKVQIDAGVIASLVSTHMGRWNTSRFDKDTVLPEPISTVQQFVHLCDYLASRSFLSFDFTKANLVYYDPQDYWIEVDLSEQIKEHISFCKYLINEKGVSRNTLNEITKNISGFKNPMRITSKEVLDKLIEAVRAFDNE